MHYVLSLELELKVETASAEGLAGALLLWVADVVRDRQGPELSAQLRQAVPELAEWGQVAPTMSVIDLDKLPPPSSGSDEDELVGMLSRFGVEPAWAPIVASLTLRFLTTRLSPESARAIAEAMPLLIGRTAA
jgi:hypothetical protein